MSTNPLPGYDDWKTTPDEGKPAPTIRRRFYVLVDIEGEENGNDALDSDVEKARVGMATWAEVALSRSHTELDVTVYDSFEDMVADREEGNGAFDRDTYGEYAEV